MQIAAVLDTGLAPTHLDWHCLADGGRRDILDLTVALAAEHGLAVRVWLDDGRARMRGAWAARGGPRVRRQLRPAARREGGPLRAAVPRPAARLSEWAVHPGPDDAGDPGGRVRATDLEFLTSATARRVVEEEGIVLVDQRERQRAWARGLLA